MYAFSYSYCYSSACSGYNCCLRYYYRNAKVGCIGDDMDLGLALVKAVVIGLTLNKINKNNYFLNVE